MVDIITPTSTIFESGRRKWIELEFAGFDGAAEYGVYDVLSEGEIDFMPNHCTAICTKTAGAETTIDVDVEISWDGTTYIPTDCVAIVAFATHGHHPKAGVTNDFQYMRPRYWKVIVVDEGTNNTMTVKLWLYGE